MGTCPSGCAGTMLVWAACSQCSVQWQLLYGEAAAAAAVSATVVRDLKGGSKMLHALFNVIRLHNNLFGSRWSVRRCCAGMQARQVRVDVAAERQRVMLAS